MIENRWWGKGDYCVTRSADGVTEATNETAEKPLRVAIAARETRA